MAQAAKPQSRHAWNIPPIKDVYLHGSTTSWNTN